MKREPPPIVIILAIAAVLRIAALSQMLWYDEAYTAMLAQMPIAQMMSATAGDVHPPTWYLIEMAFVRLFGMSEVALRLPAAILGVLAVWLTYRLARDLLDERAALISAVFVAVNPFAVYYSQEARMYALLLVAVLLAYLGAIERRWWLVALGSGLTLMSHNLAVIYIPFILLATLPLWRFGVSAVAVGAIPWLAWLPQLFHQATTGQFSGAYWTNYFTGNLVAKLLGEWTQLWIPHFRPEWIAWIGPVIAFALLVFPVVETVRRRARAPIILTSLIIGPGLLELAISAIWQPVIVARTLAGCLPVWCILIAWWILLPRRWDAPRVVLIGVAACAIFSTTIALYSFERSPSNRIILEWLKANAQPSDVICQTSESTRALFDFYIPGRSVQVTDASSDQCAWLLNEWYITMEPDVEKKVDAILAERSGESVLNTQNNPVIKTDLYRLFPATKSTLH